MYLSVVTQVKKAKTDEARKLLIKRSLDMLELYIYLIIFNAYLHSERSSGWGMPFSRWMKKVRDEVYNNIAIEINIRITRRPTVPLTYESCHYLRMNNLVL